MDLAFKGRLAVVTGADSGIGLHTAMTLAAEGARVLMTDLEKGALGAALEHVQAHAPGAEVYAFAADLTRSDEGEALLGAADAHGGAAVLALLAGTRGAAGDFLEIDDEGWRETLDTDLMGAVRVCRAFIPGMRGRGYGRIVLTASENAVQPYVEETPYNAAKAGIIRHHPGAARQAAGGRQRDRVFVLQPSDLCGRLELPGRRRRGRDGLRLNRAGHDARLRRIYAG